MRAGGVGGYPHIQDMPAGRRIRGIIRCAIGLKSLSSGCAKRCGPRVAPWSDRETVTSYGLLGKRVVEYSFGVSVRAQATHYPGGAAQ